MCVITTHLLDGILLARHVSDGRDRGQVAHEPGVDRRLQRQAALK